MLKFDLYNLAGELPPLPPPLLALLPRWSTCFNSGKFTAELESVDSLLPKFPGNFVADNFLFCFLSSVRKLSSRLMSEDMLMLLKGGKVTAGTKKSVSREGGEDDARVTSILSTPTRGEKAHKLTTPKARKSGLSLQTRAERVSFQ